MPSALQAEGVRNCRLTVSRNTFELRLAHPLKRRYSRSRIRVFARFRGRGTVADVPGQGTRLDVQVDQTPFSRALLAVWSIVLPLFLSFDWKTLRFDANMFFGMMVILLLVWAIGGVKFFRASLQANTEMMEALIRHVLNDDGGQGMGPSGRYE